MANNERLQRFGNCENEFVYIDEDVKRKIAILQQFYADCERTSISETLAIQQKEFSKCATYRTTWQAARIEYEERKKNPKKYPVICSGGLPEYHIAMISYTMDTFYWLFNQKTRQIATKEDYNQYPYRSYFYLLLRACQEINAGCLPAKQILYRGMRDVFQAHIGGEVVFQQFVSTTCKLQIAINFAGPNGCVFEITNWRPGPMCTRMGNHSEYPDEEEVLIWPFEMFVCTKSYKDANGQTRLVLKASTSLLTFSST